MFGACTVPRRRCGPRTWNPTGNCSQHHEDDSGACETENGVLRVRPDLVRPQHSRQAEQEKSDDCRGRQLLLANKELNRRGQAEQQTEHEGPAALHADDLVKEQQQDGRHESHCHVWMSERVRSHDRRESIEPPRRCQPRAGLSHSGG